MSYMAHENMIYFRVYFLSFNLCYVGSIWFCSTGISLSLQFVLIWTLNEMLNKIYILLWIIALYSSFWNTLFFFFFFLQSLTSDILQFFVGICIFNILIAEPNLLTAFSECRATDFTPVWTYRISVAVEIWPLW